MTKSTGTFIALIILTFTGQVFARGEGAFPTDTHLRERKVTPEMSKCGYCHPHKNREYLLKKNKPVREHKDHRIVHGRKEKFCGECHDVNNRYALKSTPEYPATFANPSPLCHQCHADKYKFWLLGVHGKRVGSWDRASFQYQCVDCHSPHSVNFPEMDAVPRPRTLRK